jgi:succinyl-diaminopimelate desuccinylase
MKPGPWNPVDLAQEFIEFDTTTPKDNGMQSRMISYLKKAGFTIHPLPFEGIQNFYARLGNSSPVFCFAGHTDVVPSGPEESWTTPPFSGKIRENNLFGRGAADMKGALAAMVSAVSEFLKESPLQKGSIVFLITGDEEGAAIHGTAKVMEWLREKGEKMDFCLVGEPTSNLRVGDQIKNGRRGSINGRLTLYGIQGHVAYPHLAKNPLHEGLDILKELAGLQFDRGNSFFDPTRLALTNIQGGTGTDNVTPDRVEIRFNIRFGTASTFSSIKEKIEKLLKASGQKFSVEFTLSGEAFLSEKGRLIESMIQSVQEETGITPELSTSGGTSDARFIAPEGIEVAELGLKNETIHKIDEHVSLADLAALSKIYKKILNKIFLN